MLHNNTNRDVGAVRFYGIGIGNIVADCTGERMSGFVVWGQWRGYEHGTLWDIPASISGGGGSGANPNLLNQFLSNGITEGNAIVSHNAEWNAGRAGMRVS